jgi:hypothetical protein
MQSVSHFDLCAGFGPAYRLAHSLEIFDGHGFRLAGVKSLAVVTRSSHLDSHEYPRINIIYELSRASVPSDSRCRSCEGFGLWNFRRSRKL